MQLRFRQLGVFPSPFEPPAAAAVWACVDETADTWLGALLNASLLEYDARAGEYSLHDLARLFAEKLILQDTKQAMAALEGYAGYYLQQGSAADDEYLKGSEHILPALACFRHLWVHLQTAYERLRTESKTGWPHPASADEWLNTFPGQTIYLLDLYLTPRQRLPLLSEALEAARRINDKQSQGVHLGNMGLAWADLGEARKAIEFYEQRLIIAREIGDRRGEGNALGNMGLAWADLGEARKAIEFYEQQLVIAREIGDRRGEAIGAWNLGLTYEKQGEYARACELMKIRVTYEREIRHSDAELHEQKMKEICARARQAGK